MVRLRYTLPPRAPHGRDARTSPRGTTVRLGGLRSEARREAAIARRSINDQVGRHGGYRTTKTFALRRWWRIEPPTNGLKVEVVRLSN
jgi:hypothetical protein